METPKRIALVTCASNFERHGNIIRAMHRRISDMGGYALYVLTNYGAYEDGMDSPTESPPSITCWTKWSCMAVFWRPISEATS